MTDTTDPTDTAARLDAIEYLLRQALWNIIVARVDADDGDDTDAVVETRKFAEDVLNDLSLMVFPAPDPAISDHHSALVRDHARRILRKLLSEMGEARDGS